MDVQLTLWAITTYYNPCRWKRRRDNYDIFMEGLNRVGVKCLTVECAFGTDPFELPEGNGVIHVRAESVLWQKERLLNMAANWLPRECTGVAWLDCDIVFKNPSWAIQTEELLKTHKVLQLFETCDRLDKDGKSVGDVSKSFGLIAPNHRETVSCGRYDAHGHTGYAWAMRRDIFDQVGLYEHAVSGSADHFMAHAIYNEYGFCVENALKHDPVQMHHLQGWGHQFYQLVKGSFTVVPGDIEHLWHGDLANRRYFLRMHEITDLGFDPYLDIVIPNGKPIQWAPNLQKPELVAYFMNYFQSREEDGAGVVNAQ